MQIHWKFSCHVPFFQVRGPKSSRIHFRVALKSAGVIIGLRVPPHGTLSKPTATAGGVKTPVPAEALRRFSFSVRFSCGSQAFPP